MELLNGGTVAHAYETGLGHLGADSFVQHQLETLIHC